MKRNEQVLIKIRNEKLLTATIKAVHRDGTASAQITSPESAVAGFWVLLHDDGQATPNPWYSKQLSLQVATDWYVRTANESDEWIKSHNDEIVAKRKAEAEAYTTQWIHDEAERSIVEVMKLGTSEFFLGTLKLTPRWSGNHNVIDFVGFAWEDGEVYRDVSGTIYSEVYDPQTFDYTAKVSLYLTWTREDLANDGTYTTRREERMWANSYYAKGFSLEQARQMALCKAIR